MDFELPQEHSCENKTLCYDDNARGKGESEEIIQITPSRSRISKSKSSVWNYFVRRNKDEAQCTICLKIMKSSGGSTTSLIFHLKKIHQIDIKQDTDQPSMKIARTLENSLKKISMAEEISKLAALDGFSFNSMAKSHFIQSSLHLHKEKYDKPPPASPKEVQNMVMNFYKTKKIELVSHFEEQIVLGIRYSLTLDEYKSIQNKRYININVHTRDSHWSLGVIEINGPFDSRRTVEIVRRQLGKFGLKLDAHFVGCTTDGSAVMVKFGREIKPDHQQCIAHCIHLAMIDTLYEKKLDVASVKETSEENEEFNEESTEEDSEDEKNQQDAIFQTDSTDNDAYFLKLKHEYGKIINKVRKICKLFRKSPTKNGILQGLVRVNLNGKEYKLISDRKNSWTSIFYMIERFLKLKSCIPNALRAVHSTEAVSHDEWKTLTLIYETLRPVEMILKAICAEDVNLLKAESSLEFVLRKLDKAANPLALKLRENLTDYYNSRRKAETVSLLSYLHNPNKFINNESRSFAVPPKQLLRKHAEQTHKRLFPEHYERSIEELSERTENEDEEIGQLETDTVASTSEFIDADDELMCEYASAMKKLNEEPKKDTTERGINREFDYFEVTLNRSEKLEQLYRALLTIRPTNVQAERAISITGLFSTNISTNLSGNTLNALWFLKDYFQNKVNR